MTIQETFARHMVEMYDDRGREWLEQLPSLIAEYERRWSVTAGEAFPNLSYNYVCPATRADGTPAVLKLGADSEGLLTEIEMLRHYDGYGSVRLLEADPEQGAFLLERLEPGTMLLGLADDEEATAIAAQVMQQLWRPMTTNDRTTLRAVPPTTNDRQASPDTRHPTLDPLFCSVADWAQGMTRLRKEFGGGTGPFPVALVEEAEALFAELLPSQAEPVLLHGDLHHENILAAEREPWLAIDPQGIVGEPCYEVGALLRNPTPEFTGDVRTQARRIDQLADLLGFDRKRIHGWAVAQAVLSAWWGYEDHGRLEQEWLVTAEVLSAVRV